MQTYFEGLIFEVLLFAIGWGIAPLVVFIIQCAIDLFWRIADFFQKPAPPQYSDPYCPHFRNTISPDATISNNELSPTAFIDWLFVNNFNP